MFTTSDYIYSQVDDIMKDAVQVGNYTSANNIVSCVMEVTVKVKVRNE